MTRQRRPRPARAGDDGLRAMRRWPGLRLPNDRITMKIAARPANAITTCRAVPLSENSRRSRRSSPHSAHVARTSAERSRKTCIYAQTFFRMSTSERTNARDQSATIECADCCCLVIRMAVPTASSASVNFSLRP